MSMKIAAANTTYAKLPPPFPQRCNGVFRLQPSGVVKVEGEDSSSSSSDDDSRPEAGSSVRSSHPFEQSVSSSVIAVAPTGESLSHSLGLRFTPTAFLRPKVLATGVKYAPGSIGNATLVGALTEGIVILFGGNEQVKPSNELWVYHIADRKWVYINPLEVVAEEITALRKSRGCASDRIPGPRCGHSSVMLRDVPDATKVDPATLKEVPASKPGAPSANASLMRSTSKGKSLSDAKAFASSLAGESSDVFAEVSLVADASFSAFMPSSTTTRRPSDWSYEPCMIVFGGADLSKGLYYNDLWLYDVQCMAWRELQVGGTPPKERWHHTACVLEQRMFIYGGESSDFEVLNDLHMYDHMLGAWRSLRTVEPVPPGRMLHAVTNVGDHMVVVGGVGSQSHNASLVDLAVDHGIHLNTAVNRRGSSARRGSTAFTAFEKDPSSGKELKEELSDVWVLNMRTLVWREVAKTNKRYSPFVVREDIRAQGPTVCSRGSESGPKLPNPVSGPRILYKSLEGHMAVAFDERVLIIGGKLDGKLNRRVFSLHLPTETWAFLGDMPTTTGDGELPVVRCALAGCALHERKSIHAMRDAVSLQQLDAVRRRLGEEQESFPYLEALVQQMASQISFSGVLSVYHRRPLVSRTVCAYLFGGFGSPKNFSDLWRIELNDEQADDTFEQLFGSTLDKLLSGEASKKSTSVLGGLPAQELEVLEEYVLGSTTLANSKRAAASTASNAFGGVDRNGDPFKASAGRKSSRV